jgi:hypothetical protein
MQRRHLDGDVGNGGWMRCEAPIELIEIGQSSGIEFGVDDLGAVRGVAARLPYMQLELPDLAPLRSRADHFGPPRGKRP